MAKSIQEEIQEKKKKIRCIQCNGGGGSGGGGTLNQAKVVTIGEVTATANSVNIAVHSSGINENQFNGTSYKKTTPNTFSYTPVTVGTKILIIYSLPNNNPMYYLAEGVEGLAAVEPLVPSEALIINKITVNSAGQVIEGITNRRVPYWDMTIGKLLSTNISYINNKIGIGVTGEPSEALEVNGNIKGTQFVYKVSSSNSTPNKTWTDGTYLYYTNSAGVNKRLAVDEQTIKIIPGNVTLDDSYHNCIVRITANSIITVPTGLRDDFNCVFDVYGTAVGTFVADSEVSFSAPFGLKLRDNTMCTIYKISTNEYRINGGLLPA